MRVLAFGAPLLSGKRWCLDFEVTSLQMLVIDALRIFLRCLDIFIYVCNTGNLEAN